MSRRALYASAAGLTIGSFSIIPIVIAPAAHAIDPCAVAPVPANRPEAPTGLQLAGANTSSPVLSGIVGNLLGGEVSGSIYVTDATGNAIGGSPTAVGIVDSGSRVTWHVPDGTLRPGQTYSWRLEAGTGCYAGWSPTQSFTYSPTAAPAPSGAISATIGGSSIISRTGPSDSSMLTSGSLEVGGDSSRQWISSVKADLSTIPAGAAIETASLVLHPTGCVGACSGGTMSVAQAKTDVAGVNTGTQLRSVPTDLAYSASETTTSVDVTTLVQAWTAGDVPNDGIVLFGPANATAGEKFSSASLDVTYMPAHAPTSPTSLTLTPGDGGVMVAWGEPASTGYTDSAGQTDGITNYTVTATSPTGQVVVSRTASDTSVLLDGLTDGNAYKVSVTGTNPVGTGPAATATATPKAVPGGPQTYQAAVSQLMNANDALQMGTASTAAAAIASDTQQAEISSWLNNTASSDIAMKNYAAAHRQKDTNDTTTLSNVLVAPSADGSTVTVYATATENFTTIDTSGTTAVSIPGSAIDNVAYTFTTGSSTQVTAEGDAAATDQPVTMATADTAYSAALDPVAADPTPVATDSTGDFAPPAAGMTPSTRSYSYLPGVASWADRNWNGTNNSYGNDCTDFTSRALHWGGGLAERIPAFPALETSDDNNWYQYRYWYGYRASSYSWGGAWHLANFEVKKGAYWEPYISWGYRGEVIFANWTGASWTGISHDGVISVATSSNLYIDQHTNSRYREPLYKWAGHQTWQGSNPQLTVFITPALS